MSLFGDNDGVLYTVMDDHKKPNIIRGSSGPKVTKKQNVPQVGTVIRHDTMSRMNGNTVVNPIKRSNSVNLFDTFSVEDQGESSGDHIIVAENQIIEQIEMPLSDDSESSKDQVYQASIQTESGNFLVLVRDGEIIGMQPEEDLINGVHDDNEHEHILLQEDCSEEQVITADVLDPDENSSASIPPVTKVETETIECENESTQEAAAAVASIIDSDSSVIDIQGIETEIPNSIVESDLNNEQYVVVELSDGTSILLPASSLQSSDGLGLDNNQIFLNTNGDELVQVVNGFSSVADLNNGHSSTPQYSLQNKPRRPAKKKNPDNPLQAPSKRICSGKSSSSKFTNSTQQRSCMNMKKQTLTSSNSYISHTQTMSTTCPSVTPTPDVEPKPFRFDFPEDEELSMEGSDYLSLVIQQYQKENK